MTTGTSKTTVTASRTSVANEMKSFARIWML